VHYTKVAGRTEPFSQSDPWVANTGAAVARFVWLRSERRAYLVLSEVEVYGKKVK
jgi:hypothetical protein